MADLQGAVGARSGKIVLISGDEEYRSEETCPMLAKILSQRHGFDCTVLFSIDPEKGFIDPNNQQSLPGPGGVGIVRLDDYCTRFRQLSDADYAQLARYLNRGGPVIGFRTATHAFRGSGQSGAFKWSQFGLKILGKPGSAIMAGTKVRELSSHRLGCMPIILSSMGWRSSVRPMFTAFAT